MGILAEGRSVHRVGEIVRRRAGRRSSWWGTIHFSRCLQGSRCAPSGLVTPRTRSGSQATWQGEQHATMAGRLTDCDAGGLAAFSPVLISTVAVPRIARRLRWRPPRELENGVFSDVVRRSSGTATCSLARLPRLDRAV